MKHSELEALRAEYRGEPVHEAMIAYAGCTFDALRFTMNGMVITSDSRGIQWTASGDGGTHWIVSRTVEIGGDVPTGLGRNITYGIRCGADAADVLLAMDYLDRLADAAPPDTRLPAPPPPSPEDAATPLDVLRAMIESAGAVTATVKQRWLDSRATFGGAPSPALAIASALTERGVGGNDNAFSIEMLMERVWRDDLAAHLFATSLTRGVPSSARPLVWQVAMAITAAAVEARDLGGGREGVVEAVHAQTQHGATYLRQHGLHWHADVLAACRVEVDSNGNPLLISPPPDLRLAPPTPDTIWPPGVSRVLP